VDPTGAVSAGILDIGVPVFPAYVARMEDYWVQVIPSIRGDGGEVAARVYMDVRTAIDPGPYVGFALIGVIKEPLGSELDTVSFFGIVIVGSHTPGGDSGGRSKRVGHWTARFSESVSSPYSEVVVQEHMTRIQLE
jgi:hypothetical protein